MNWSEQCAAVIPCLNEGASIAAVVSGVRRHLTEVIVIDDGSTDATSTEAGAAGAEVLRNPVAEGKGAALIRGWSRARERGFRWALSLDGDGQHAADDIPALLECAARTGARLVVGNRMLAARGMPFVRRAVNRWMSARLSSIARQPMPDTQCGFRLMNLDAWSSVQRKNGGSKVPPDERQSSASHFEIESEVLIAFARAGFKIEFVPVRTIYDKERSKIHPWRDTIRWWRWWRVQRGMKKNAQRTP